MPAAQLRFHEVLNDFLPPQRRKVAFTHAFTRRTPVKDLSESLGVPHAESAQERVRIEYVRSTGLSIDAPRTGREENCKGKSPHLQHTKPDPVRR